VSFEAAPGRVLGLLGPNGAGKTTTLRMLATILSPTAGSFRVDGVDGIRDPESVRRRIGFLTGATGVYDRLTTREMVTYFAKLHGMSDDRVRERCDDLFARLRMEDIVDSQVGQLSSGQRQKVSIARAIVHDPPVLILDEPTTSLDVLVARTVVEFIRDARDQGRCVVLSTHVLAEAEKLCDEIAIIHEGRIRATGTLDDIVGGSGCDDLESAFFRIVLDEEEAR
jgi:sodium transport system ATP-binding protein